ncbi:putative phosphoribosyltransferase protein [Coleophoma crateriformis]|uniref:Putative phosphoribosyltransferase protein n=1 Tax=Coleophoma crateriformis TaxID=565419 RepID=A0A3D8RPM0_9HELO|nr:putative phosphoribosyltransferase protein [Coleophoma crateriformis]
MSDSLSEGSGHEHFTEPTTNYWQELLPQTSTQNQPPPWKYGVPVTLPDSQVLVLPIRQLKSSPEHGVASLLVNHASIEVVEVLGRMLGEKIKETVGDEEVMVVGLPTLGLSLAPIIAKAVGLKRYVPLGYSHKFWYSEKLSTSVSSITSPGLNQKRVYLDPYLLPLVRHKKIIIIDDAVSSGKTLKAVWDLLEDVAESEVVACGVAMKQGDVWRNVMGDERAEKCCWVFESPLLRAVNGGWDLRS